MRPTVFIVNPTSSSGRTARRIDQMRPTIDALFKDAKLLFTQGPLHATELTRNALKDDAELVVSVGGDGTLNEVVNGFFEHGHLVNPSANLAMVMSGTGADFRRSIGWPGDAQLELHKVKNGIAKPVDVGIVQATQSDHSMRERYFINTASIGLSALTAAIVHDDRRGKKNRFAYLLAALRANRSYVPTNMTAIIDNKTGVLDEVSFLTFANGGYFGGGLHIAPKANLSDGLAEIVCASRLDLLYTLFNVHRVYRGTHLSLSRMSYFQASQMTVDCPDKTKTILVEADGEPCGQLPAKFQIVKHSINLIQ